RTPGTVGYRSPSATARKMSIREKMMPKSFEVQRTKARTLPGSNDTSFGGSWCAFFSQLAVSLPVSSTSVRSLMAFYSVPESERSLCGVDLDAVIVCRRDHPAARIGSGSKTGAGVGGLG